MSANGNGSGGDYKGGYFSNRLRTLLAEAEAEAAALRRIIARVERVDPSAAATKRKGAGAMIDQALEIDATRRAGKAKKRKAGGPGGKVAIRKQRTNTAKVLADFSRTEPRNVHPAQRPTLTRYGYIARKGDGWIRTAKEFSIEKPVSASED